MLQVPATIEAVSTRADRTIKIVVGTQELSSEDNAELMKLAHSMGYFLFKDSPVSEKEVVDIPDFTPEYKGEKSPSQRLRAALYVLWEQQGKQGGFEQFYRERMEKLITFVKEKLQ